MKKKLVIYQLFEANTIWYNHLGKYDFLRYTTTIFKIAQDWKNKNLKNYYRKIYIKSL